MDVARHHYWDGAALVPMLPCIKSVMDDELG